MLRQSREAAAQHPDRVADSGVRRVAGRVVRPGSRGVLPVRGEWVTLHRVGRDAAGPLDSVRSGPDGRYAFRYRPSGSAEAIYFVSATRGGIAYFSPPLRGALTTGDDAQLTVFDTTSAPITLHVRGRHMVVGLPATDGSREVTEVYELSNDTSLTVVARDSSSPVWTAIVPATAHRFEVRESDVAPEAVSLVDGHASVFAPIAPGLKQLVFTYRVAARALPLSVPLERPTSVLEVLVEDPRGTAAGAALSEVAPVEVGGRRFRRFVAQDAPGSAVLRIDAPGRAEPPRTLYVAIVATVVGVAMLVALARTAVRPREVPTATPPPDSSERLARDIARLDAVHEQAGGRDPAAEYEARRARLKAALTAALARRGDRP